MSWIWRSVSSSAPPLARSIEGRFLPNERRLEGPFGEFMGYYVPAGPNAVFEVLGVTARRDAVFHSILCGTEEEVLTLSLSISANIYKRLINPLAPTSWPIPTCTNLHGGPHPKIRTTARCATRGT